jgi:HlyD family secretion protein
LRVPNAALRFRPPESLIEAASPVTRAQVGNAGVVYIAASNGKVRAIPVKLGITDGNFTEVEDGGLSANQQVIDGISTTAPASAPASAAPSVPRRF